MGSQNQETDGVEEVVEFLAHQTADEKRVGGDRPMGHLSF